MSKAIKNLTRVYFTVKNHPKIEINGIQALLSDMSMLEIETELCNLLREGKIKMTEKRVKKGMPHQGKFFSANLKTGQQTLF